MTCGTGPYTLAFPDESSLSSAYIDYIFNSFFLLDIIQNFFSAYQTHDLTIVDERKVINYYLIYHRFIENSEKVLLRLVCSRCDSNSAV